MERYTSRNEKGDLLLCGNYVPGNDPDTYNAICELESYEDAMERLGLTLEKMERAKAVVALPTPRLPLVWGDDDQETVLCPDCGEDLMGIPYGERMVLQCPACGQYLNATKVLTRAEAEAALSGGERDG